MFCMRDESSHSLWGLLLWSVHSAQLKVQRIWTGALLLICEHFKTCFPFVTFTHILRGSIRDPPRLMAHFSLPFKFRIMKILGQVGAMLLECQVLLARIWSMSWMAGRQTDRQTSLQCFPSQAWGLLTKAPRNCLGTEEGLSENTTWGFGEMAHWLNPCVRTGTVIYRTHINISGSWYLVCHCGLRK